MLSWTCRTVPHRHASPPARPTTGPAHPASPWLPTTPTHSRERPSPCCHGPPKPLPSPFCMCHPRPVIYAIAAFIIFHCNNLSTLFSSVYKFLPNKTCVLLNFVSLAILSVPGSWKCSIHGSEWRWSTQDRKEGTWLLKQQSLLNFKLRWHVPY